MTASTPTDFTDLREHAPDLCRRLRVLRRVTGADEVPVTTITHAHADRVRSYELLARAWGSR